jgi:hypothetical protein
VKNSHAQADNDVVWKHCSLSPSFRVEEAGSTGKIQQILKVKKIQA